MVSSGAGHSQVYFYGRGMADFVGGSDGGAMRDKSGELYVVGDVGEGFLGRPTIQVGAPEEFFNRE